MRVRCTSYGIWQNVSPLRSQSSVASAVGDNRGCIRDRRGAGMDHSTVQSADRARRGDFLYVETLVSMDNTSFIGVCSVPRGAALAWFALVEESLSRNRFHSLAGLDLVRAPESFRVDVQSACERNLCKDE